MGLFLVREGVVFGIAVGVVGLVNQLFLVLEALIRGLVGGLEIAAPRLVLFWQHLQIGAVRAGRVGGTDQLLCVLFSADKDSLHL